MSRLSTLLIGNESLLIQCGEILLAQGHAISAIVSHNDDIHVWAGRHKIRCETPGKDLVTRLHGFSCDWLLSIANLEIIADDVLAMAHRGAVNFHDGPLPRYAGLNAPVWSLINGEKQHGITWHLIGRGVDKGDIITQRMFDITPGETALTLNTKCYAAAIDSFDDVLAALIADVPAPQKQDLSQRSYFSKAKRPVGMGRLDFTRPAAELVGLINALDHGDYYNPMTAPKIEFHGQIIIVLAAAATTGVASTVTPGTVLATESNTLIVATATTPIRLTLAGLPSDLSVKPGDILASLTIAQAAELNAALSPQIAAESRWRTRLERLAPVKHAWSGGSEDTGVISQPLSIPPELCGDDMLAAMAALAARLSDQPAADCAYQSPKTALADAAGYIADWVPLRIELDQTLAQARADFAADLGFARTSGGYLNDLPHRMPGSSRISTPDIGLSDTPNAKLVPGTTLTLAVTDGHATMMADANRISPAMLQFMSERVEMIAASLNIFEGLISDLPILPEAERELVLRGWNATAIPHQATTIHAAFEAQVARTPDATALISEGETLSYSALNAAANRVAHTLRKMGVKPGTPVGLSTDRSTALLIGALGVLKAGGAYVPLDPAYPADRIAHYVADSAAPVIVTQTSLASALPAHNASVLLLDADPRLGKASADNPTGGASPDDLAYLIYTSGSTGRPKGVMVEHRNVANFFAGMDARIPHDTAGVWLAITSLSFDISVLELFYTLARGFKVVLSGDDNRALGSSGQLPVSDKGMDFSLYYWGNDDAVGTRKYELLIEGAKFADANGFCAVWTPERHFHAFGGPYPNPSVTGAAVAAVTKNLAVRAGSIVAPLHHPARIAEEWAVIDNLTGGRVGLAMASGWQPDDFILRPENTPPHNKAALSEAIKTVRRLWAGEAVEFPTQSGGKHAVVTQPRPISAQMPMWVTTAGNPATWIEAGELGANVLTHLLGQSVDEVADKINIYHDALRKAGHDPADHKVTLMLHTYLAESREQAREIAREPMKSYLRSAAGLIKQYAWAFPAFKRPQGVKNAFDLDLGSLEPEELEGILDYAFERYFNDSGMFGTVDDCVARVESLKLIGVDEVACLIEYGIATETVLAGLHPLAEVLRRTNTPTTLAEDDYSIAAQIIRHDVTHLQCTPSMARMITMNDEARTALGRVKHLLIGGEALPGALVDELNQITKANIENMYGPTETTIWSSTFNAHNSPGIVPIGTPIANTQVYVLDAQQRPVPIGVEGELYIGGHGVTRGYWQRDDLTAERFVTDPFVTAENTAPSGARMYRTGDLVRWRSDGQLDFLGRIDHQIKLRGYRIELGEIETAMQSFDAVKQAVVLAREDTPGAVQLVGYITTTGPVNIDALRSKLAEQLPDHMIPAHFVTLEKFDLTPNRKIDRNTLPVPAKTKQVQKEPPPVSQTEAQIAAIWSRILGVSGITSRDNFFDLGGHSLLAVQAHREIRDTLGVGTLSITDVFRFPTLAAIAARVSVVGGSDQPARRSEPAPVKSRANIRADAMQRRRDMRARRGA